MNSPKLACRRQGLALLAAAVVCANPHAVFAGTVPEFRPVGPAGGTITALVRAKSDNDRIYAATATGRVFRSKDGGDSWTRLPEFSDVETRALAVDPLDADVVYAGLFGSGGLFRSEDGGETWEMRSDGLELIPGLGGFAETTALAVDPNSAATVYAGIGAGDSGLHKTLDAGLSWSPTGLERGKVVQVVIAPSNSNIVYVAGVGEVFRSADAGATFSPTAELFSPSGGGVSVQALAVDPGNASIVYVATGHGVFRSADSGASWQARNSGLTVESGGEQLPLEALSIVVDPADAAKLWVGAAPPRTAAPEGALGSAGGLFRTTNSGASWSAIPGIEGGFGEPALTAVSIDSGATMEIAVGTLASGVWRSSDGGANWRASNDGLNARRIDSVAVDPNNPNTVFVGTGATGFYRTVDGGKNWESLSLVLGRPFVPLSSYPVTFRLGAHNYPAVLVDPTTPATVYAIPPVGTAPTGVRKSLDGGLSWTSVNTGLPAVFGLSARVDGLAMDPLNSAVLYATIPTPLGATSPNVFKTTNGAASWAAADSGLFGTGDPALEPTGFAIDQIDPTRLYAARERDGFFHSTDGGASWSLASDFESECIVASRTVEGGVFAIAESSGFFGSTDGGSSFVHIPGLPSQANGTCQGLFLQPAGEDQPEAFYVSDLSGPVFVTVDGGAVWVEVTSLPSPVLSMDAADTSAVYAGTRRDGLFRLRTSGSTTTTSSTSTTLAVETSTTTSTSLPVETTTTTLEVPNPCGDPVMSSRAVTATDALRTLRAAVGSAECELCVCDVDNSGRISATDALLVLKFAVGSAVVLSCPPCLT